MSKTAREAVSEFLLAFQSDRDTTEQGYSDLVTTLGEAGFVILPKRPTAKMIDAVTLWDYANGEGAIRLKNGDQRDWRRLAARSRDWRSFQAARSIG
jgi:hypothetical protein